ncbi:hypothetical protein [Microbacterium sp. SA39]|uniref:hypothetical protein n=1 Tax=Microbacterium sp. SA39 TaxID=1263625 RepID=UPI0005FA5231|nr:hypothetical protein [Microbacterium sp. SA39]
MGMFEQRKEEENQWAGLPSEPLDRGAADVLDTAPPVDPMALGLGAQVTSIVFPVAPQVPDAVSTENSEPEDETDD